MTISKIYRDSLIKEIIKDSLKAGRVLTKGEIEEALAEKIKKNSSLDSPFAQREIYEIQEGESASALKMNSISRTVRQDLSVIYEALTKQSFDVTAMYDSVNSELKGIEKRIRKLEEDSKNLLIISKNGEGYLDYVSDTFTNKNKINIDKTDLFVDSKSGTVTLKPLTHSRIGLKLIESDLQFNVLTRSQLQGTSLAPSSSKVFAFTDGENAWIQRVQMKRGVGTVTADLIIKMPNTNAEISKIVFRPATSDEGSITSVVLQYSDDGLNWFNPDGDKNKRLIGDVSFIVSPKKANYWKFIFTKTGYDEHKGNSYIYEFGAKSIQFYGIKYKKVENKLFGELTSNLLRSSSNKGFNRVSLKTCETLPSKTNINYKIAGLTDFDVANFESGALTLDQLHFNNIDPLDRENSVHPIAIDFSKLSPLTGITSSYGKDNTTSFRDRNSYNSLLDYILPSNIEKNETIILRNIGNNLLDNGSGDSVKVKGISNGWAFDGSYYTCGFYIHEDSGRTIDFGPESLEIDRTLVSGKVSLNKGFHKAKISKSNWRGIRPGDIVSTDNPDILYPYNHKYLIEGIGNTLYGEDMTALVSGKTKLEIVDPGEVYLGVQRYWEKRMERVTPFNFVQNISSENYNVYAFTLDLNGDKRIMIKDSLEPGLLTEEKIAIITRTVSSDLHTAIILKAAFSSEDSGTTPVLDEYIVRLGL